MMFPNPQMDSTCLRTRRESRPTAFSSLTAIPDSQFLTPGQTSAAEDDKSR